MFEKENNSTNTIHLPGVGKQTAKQLSRLGIQTIEDLLFHLPSRYQDRTTLHAIRDLVPTKEALVEGYIVSVTQPHRSKTKLLCVLKDHTHTIRLRFFHIFTNQIDALTPGTRLRCYSEVRLGQSGLEMIHPEFQVISESTPIPIEEQLTPIYPATEGLSQHMLRKLTLRAIDWMDNSEHFRELIPSTLLHAYNLPALKEAVKFIHRPPGDVNREALFDCNTLAQKRLIFEELLAHRLSLLQLKQVFQGQSALPFVGANELSERFLKSLPYQLTKAQQRVINEIKADLSQPYPMLRLLQGDVGSGKTVVCAHALLQAVASGCQAALMAPTELLAQQHYRVINAWFAPLGIKTVSLSHQVKASEKKAILQDIRSGEANIIIGTHALFQEGVEFHQLALVCVDEQHRFGVEQRALLREKGKKGNHEPHQLVMTATPIPRTLAMTFYADLECSVIDELPPGRTQITTSLVMSGRRQEVILRIREACLQGRQVYWVCPLIDESDVISAQAATQTLESLRNALPELSIALIHGRMSAEEKLKAMQDFQQGKTHLLVATTVIEVGVDVPNASVMVIENAERLGLSQLHQLRGRVGRGTVESYCVLLYEHSLSDVAKERLRVMRETTDGFEIAERDLALRGPGEVLGTRQTGELAFRVADLMRDHTLFPNVQALAARMLSEHPELIAPLVRRWLGDKKEYVKV